MAEYARLVTNREHTVTNMQSYVFLLKLSRILAWHAQVAALLIAKVQDCIGVYALYQCRSRLPAILLLMRPLRDRHAKYVKLRQASEWGKQALQGCFTRLKSRLTYCKGTRRTILTYTILA